MITDILKYAAPAQGFGMGAGRGKINAPTMAYATLHGKTPDTPIMGRESNHPTRAYRGIGLDASIPTKAMDKLNDINGIDLRSSCQGDSSRHPTFLIFRPLNQDTDYVRDLVEALRARNKDLKVSYDMGMEGKYRVCVTADLWEGSTSKKNFDNWWLSLADKIKDVL